MVFNRIKKVLIYLISAGIIIAAIVFAVSRNPQKSFFGYRIYTVLTPSMEPELAVGDMVIVKISDAADINEGDIITFNPSSDGDAYLTHRVTQKMSDYEGTGVTCFITKGDANEDEDGFVLDESRVIGKVNAHVPKLGYIVRFIQLKWYFVIPLFIMLIVFVELMKFYLSDNTEALNTAEENPSASESSAPEHVAQTCEVNKESEAHISGAATNNH